MTTIIKQETTVRSTGFCGLLTIAFIVLKLTGFIDWSWLWVLSPMWIPMVMVFAIIGLIMVSYLLIVTIKHFMDKQALRRKRNARYS